MWQLMSTYWEFSALAATFLGPVLTVGTLLWVLSSRKEATSTVAWCLVIVLMPFLGPVLFYLFGYQHVSRPLSRKQRHRRWFQTTRANSQIDWTPSDTESEASEPAPDPSEKWSDFARLAQRYGASPLTSG